MSISEATVIHDNEGLFVGVFDELIIEDSPWDEVLQQILDRSLLSMDNAESGVEFDCVKSEIGDVKVVYCIYEKRSEDGYELRGIFNPARCPPKLLREACAKLNEARADEWLVERFEMDPKCADVSICPDIYTPDVTPVSMKM